MPGRGLNDPTPWVEKDKDSRALTMGESFREFVGLGDPGPGAFEGGGSNSSRWQTVDKGSDKFRYRMGGAGPVVQQYTNDGWKGIETPPDMFPEQPTEYEMPTESRYSDEILGAVSKTEHGPYMGVAHEADGGIPYGIKMRGPTEYLIKVLTDHPEIKDALYKLLDFVPDGSSAEVIELKMLLEEIANEVDPMEPIE